MKVVVIANLWKHLIKKEESIMFRILCLAVVMSLAFLDLAAYALEPIATYDTFTALTIDDSKWREGETVRQVKAGKLFLSRRTTGNTGSDVGQISESLPLNFLDTAAVTDIKATVTVTQNDITECTTNPAITRTRARLQGVFFNTDTPTAGSAINDILAQIALERRSDSVEPPGVFNIKAFVSLCTNNDCTTGTVVDNNVKDMGTVTVGTPVILYMRWDADNNRFLFKRDADKWLIIPYNFADTAQPGRPGKGVSVINNVDTCNSDPVASAFISATFDNVAVNLSAVQP
jgi:hypothetical protein